METATAAIEQQRSELQRRTHRRCFACGAPDEGGLNLRFTSKPDGGVTAAWMGSAKYQSYDGMLHGGIIATLLDSAMVHALFARGIAAHTAELRVRYRHPVESGIPLQVTANVVTQTGPLHLLTAEIAQKNTTCATAEAKFMRIASP